ncbi:MAG: hypothetical protein GX981_06210 [Tissierellia bacterium]|nr:hypothetical protein [Tissierellia bacterium]
MKRRIILSLFVLIMVFTIPNMSYAASSRIRNTNNRYQVNVPEESTLATGEKVAVISGKAPEGTSIVIEVYGTTDLTGKKFNLNKLPSAKDYILISSETIKSGSVGFGKEIELVNGINKIVVIFKIKGEPQEQRIIYVYDKVSFGATASSPYLLSK